MIRDEVCDLLQQAISKTGIEDSNIALFHPADPNHGDFATSIALKYAKARGVAPMDLALEIAKNIEKSDIIEKLDIIEPGFINLTLKTAVLLNELKSIDDSYGKGSAKDQLIIVEFSSPNIAKPFTIGHLRSTIIGDSIARILAFYGYKIKTDNHVGDWGTQFGKQIYAIKTWGDEEIISKAENPVKELVKLYVRFHKEAEKDDTLEDKAREWFKKLEDGDSEARRLWNLCIEWSWKEFNALYHQLGVAFTENKGHGYGESYFEKDLSSIVQELREKNVVVESEGALIVDFGEGGHPPLMILKKDGSSLYATRDLATDKFRLTMYGKNIRIINEVGIEQSLYFQQLYETEIMLGWFDADQRTHVKHGHFRFKDQKMSTRKGNVIWLEDVLKEAKKRAVSLSRESSLLDISEHVAIASLKWNDLKRDSKMDVIFDWDEILNMNGNSGPYMLYTYVRTQSILKQAGESNQKRLNDVSGGDVNPEEKAIVRTLYQFPEVVEQAANQYAPSLIATYLFSLAQSYNLFYQKHQVLKAEGDSRLLRLKLTEAVGIVLKSGLNLLGIETVEKM
jgi:arginyl-tRNA synthetase